MNNETDHLRNEIKDLKRWNYIFLLVGLGLFGLLMFSFFLGQKESSFDTITAKQILVTDNFGRERVIISSQISSANFRKRNDTLSGILVLDENGIDRVALGSTPTIQSNGEITRRIDNSNPYGLTFNDSLGNERGGFGYYDNRGYVSFSMNNKTGEVLNMFVADENHYGQKVGIIMQSGSKGQLVYLGSSENMGTMLNLDFPSKGRISLVIDSTGNATINHIDYQKIRKRVLLDSN